MQESNNLNALRFSNCSHIHKLPQACQKKYVGQVGFSPILWMDKLRSERRAIQIESSRLEPGLKDFVLIVEGWISPRPSAPACLPLWHALHYNGM